MSKNILFLIESLRDGGSERSISNVAQELSNKYNTILVVANKQKLDYSFNGKIIEIKEFISHNPLKRLIGIKKLKTIKKKNNIDIAISYLTAYNLYNVLSKYKDKIYISIRNHLSTKKEGLLAFIGTIYSNKKADKIICCSKSVETDQIKNYHAKKEKTKVIENFTYDKEKQNIKKDNIIITVGRLTKHKEQEHIIKAMTIVTKKRKDAKLLILGRGNYKDYLEQLIKEYNLENNIKMIDYTKEVDKYLNKSKIFVLASDYEGFSNALLEAMSSSLPVIVTASPGGNCEILIEEEYKKEINKPIHGKYGILIPSFINEHNTKKITKNEKILAKEILNLLSNKKDYNYYKKMSKERSNHYNKNIIIKKWITIIEEDNI